MDWGTLKQTYLEKGFIALFLGTGTAQLIQLIGVFILSRIYSPEHFGVLGLFISVLNILAIFSAGGYTQAIMLPKEDQKAIQLLKVCLALILGSSLLCAACCYLIPFSFSFTGNETFFSILPLSLLVYGASLPLKVWANRLKAYKTLSTASILFNLFSVAVSVYLGWKGQVIEGLLFGLLAGQIVQFFFLIFTLSKNWIKSEEGPYKPLLRDYAAFFKYGMLSDVVNSIARELPFLMLPYLFGEVVLGHFVMAMRFLMLPFNLISQNLGTVFFEKASSTVKEGMLQKLTKETLKSSFLLGVLIYLILFLLAPIVLPMFLGAGWGVTIVFIQYLSLWMVFRFGIVPISYLFEIFRAQKEEFYFNGLKFLITFLSLYLGSLLFDASISILLFGLSNALFFLIYLRYLLHLSSTKKE